MTSWSCAALSCLDRPLLHALAASAITRLPGAVPQDITLMAWSFAALGVQHDPLMEALSAASLRRIQECETQ
eukprot:CAMPEP_0171086710 /NCGR_PEP_ID=MMETSP0766_2-20121228/19715_1 /TAXON_ID=439317 /ORGANISM="Gambierdiscus australes, Strain CAWD 149" /LENGTH=71 /DNA_ID=CAMNT_0011544377 /DNA_START=85 /DNA_END=297 /DNA_ORIENTATION=+